VSLLNTPNGNGEQAIEVTNAESVFRFDSLVDSKRYLMNEGLE
jgi:hypothetical protein